MLQILVVISPLFLIIFVSAIFQKYKKIGEEWSRVMNSYALNVGFPVLIFSALAKTSASFQEELSLIVANSSIIIVGFVLAFIIGKILNLNKKMFLTLFICFMFGNTAYLGIPVLTKVYGEQILSEVSLIIAIYLFWIFTIGIGVLDYSISKNKSNVLKNILINFINNPLLIAVVFGLIFGSLKIPIPSVVAESLDMISASVAPIVLLVIGFFIGGSKVGKFLEWIPVLLFSLFTILLFPAIFYFGVKFFGLTPSQFSTSIIEASMPLAITPFALAYRYDLDKTFIARSIILSTVLSVITLPFWIMLVK